MSYTPLQPKVLAHLPQYDALCCAQIQEAILGGIATTGATQCLNDHQATIAVLPEQCPMRHTHSCLPLQIKAEDCLKLEEERVTNYMHQSSRPSLLKEVETELLQQHQTTLLEKEQSGCAALLQDDKVKGLNWVSASCP